MRERFNFEPLSVTSSLEARRFCSKKQGPSGRADGPKCSILEKLKKKMGIAGSDDNEETSPKNRWKKL